MLACIYNAGRINHLTRRTACQRYTYRLTAKQTIWHQREKKGQLPDIPDREV